MDGGGGEELVNNPQRSRHEYYLWDNIRVMLGTHYSGHSHFCIPLPVGVHFLYFTYFTDMSTALTM